MSIKDLTSTVLNATPANQSARIIDRNTDGTLKSITSFGPEFTIPAAPVLAEPGINDLTLVVNGVALSGWQEVRVSRGAERCPSDFDVAVTERYPGQVGQIDIQPGNPCQVKIGPDLVVTGFIDRYAANLSTSAHAVRIFGRSKCEDLVDCAAVIQGMQISGASALALAQQLAQPYGVTVSSLSGNGPAIPQFNVNLGETPFEIIERIARYSALLAYDDTDGNLLLAQAGATSMASGFVQGANVQSAAVTYSMDERFSEYIAVTMSVDKLSDIGSGGNLNGIVTDSTVPRFRRRIIVSEQFVNGQSIALQRANWEKARRFGRSQAVTVTCDSWRDSAGALWAPNAKAPVHIPALKIQNATWLISEVSFSRSAERGTVADVVLMPPEAFTPEPTVLQLYDWQVGQALSGAGQQ